MATSNFGNNVHIIFEMNGKEFSGHILDHCYIDNNDIEFNVFINNIQEDEIDIGNCSMKMTMNDCDIIFNCLVTSIEHSELTANATLTSREGYEETIDLE